jgi:hypothetical protein
MVQRDNKCGNRMTGTVRQVGRRCNRHLGQKKFTISYQFAARPCYADIARPRNVVSYSLRGDGFWIAFAAILTDGAERDLTAAVDHSRKPDFRRALGP